MLGFLKSLTSDSRSVSPRDIGPAPKTKKQRLTHSVYVVELTPSVWRESKKFREANPHYRSRKGCLYVGMTSHTPQERFEKHVKGHRNKKGHKVSSKFVEKYGLYLRPTLYHHLNPLTRADAATLEKTLANSLKKRGYAVWWN